jgi:plastocyanin
MSGHGAALGPGRSTARIAKRSAAVALLVVGALSGLAMPAVSVTDGVEVLDFGYSPDEMAITAGDEVVWTNVGRAAHTVTVDDGSAGAFDSGPIASGESFSHVFDNAGTFVYHCRIYTSMTAVVKVAPGPAMTMTPQAQATTTESPETTTSSEPTTTSTTTRRPTPTTPSTAAPSAPPVVPSPAAPPQPITITTTTEPATLTTMPSITSTTGHSTLAPAGVPSSTTSSTSALVAGSAPLPSEATGADTATGEEVGAAERELLSDAGGPRPSRDGRMAAAGAVLIVAAALWSIRLRRIQRR